MSTTTSNTHTDKTIKDLKCPSEFKENTEGFSNQSDDRQWIYNSNTGSNTGSPRYYIAVYKIESTDDSTVHDFLDNETGYTVVKASLDNGTDRDGNIYYGLDLNYGLDPFNYMEFVKVGDDLCFVVCSGDHTTAPEVLNYLNEFNKLNNLEPIEK